jgi:hypothetical protein
MLTGRFARCVEVVMPLRTCLPMSGATLHPSDPFDREHEPIVGDKRLERLIDRLPRFLRSSVRWLRQPSLIWLRIPAGVLLIAGGLLSFLPTAGAVDASAGRDFAVGRFAFAAVAANAVSGLDGTPPPALVRRLMIRRAPLRSFFNTEPAGGRNSDRCGCIVLGFSTIQLVND